MMMSPSHGTFREVSQGFLNVHIQNYCNYKCIHVILGTGHTVICKSHPHIKSHSKQAIYDLKLQSMWHDTK